MRSPLSPRYAAVLLGFSACTSGLTSGAVPSAAADLLQYRWVDTSPRPDSRRYVDGTGQTYTLSDTIALSLRDVARAEAHPHRLGATTLYDVIVRLTPAGAQVWAATTAAHVGQRIAVLLDGKIVQTPIVTSPLGGVAGVVTTASAPAADSICSRINKAVVTP